MKAIKAKKRLEEKDWILPGTKISHEDFVAGIHKAEEGPFFTPEEFESRFAKWKKEKGYN